MKKYFLLGAISSTEQINDLVIAQNQIISLGNRCETLQTFFESHDKGISKEELLKALIAEAFKCDEIMTLPNFTTDQLCMGLVYLFRLAEKPFQDFTQFFYNNGSTITNEG